MTPLALTYFLLGLSALYWPMVTLFFKRRVLGAQWLIMTALLAMALSIIIYSSFFNNFLQGEYLLVIIFMILSMFTPPLIQAAVTSLTDTSPNRSPLTKLHILVLPAVVVVFFMAVSVIIGGADMYRLWIERGTVGGAHLFYENSWRYNLIVAVHYYLYWILIIAETTFVGIYSLVRIRRFSRMLDDYYTVNRINRTDLYGTYFFVALNCFFVVASYLFFPFNSPRPLLAVVIGSVLQAAVMFFIGYFAFRTPTGAEELNEKKQRLASGMRRDMVLLGRHLGEYVEKENAYLNPDMSVFLLAEHFHVSEDEIIDAVHRLHGSSFADYIDSLRIEHAIQLMNENREHLHTDDPDDLARLAHQCGYLDRFKLELSFQRIMQTSLQHWLDDNL